MAIWSAEIKELERLYESFKGQFPVLEKELEQLIKFDDPNVILLYSRRCLEVILTDLCKCELKRPRGTEPLKGIIDKLHKEHKVPDHIATSMHGLNDLSTYGTHPKDFDPEQVKPVLNNLDIILKWYLKYKGFKVVVKPEQEVQTIDIKPEIAKAAPSPGRTLILRPYILAAIILVGALLFLQNRNSRKKWAKEVALTEIEQLVNEDNIAGAFSLVQKAKKFISKEPKFEELSSLVTSDLTILTEPPGADVYIREYSDTAGKWEKLDRTPINGIKMPDQTFYVVRIEKPEYEYVLAVMRTGSDSDTLSRKMFKKGEIPSGMVYVDGLGNQVSNNSFKNKNGFFIDKFEVTNRQFKEFIEKGGYRNPEYWQNKFIKNGKELSWAEAIAVFKDNTDRPGPANWEAGYYPEGQDEYPVTGISWYEAAAYAEYAGKSLPTAEHWGSAIGFHLPYISATFGSKILPLSNFHGKGSDKAGKSLGISCFGAFDMAGNVREWCWNETPVGHIIRGGAWNDATYLYSDMSQLPSFDRSEKNGFRCVQYIDNDKIPGSVFQLISKIEGWGFYSGDRDFSKEKPVEDRIFEVYKNQFLYDKTPLNAVIEETDNTYEDWTIEKITFDAAYEEDRIIVYLFLPRNVSHPYQTIIFWPGLNATWENSLLKYHWQESIDFLLKSGRAVLFPVYYRTFERKDGPPPAPADVHQLTDWAIKDIKDLRRSIDYLETRPDIDTGKLGFYGVSWGASTGPFTAVERRIKLNILIVGGFNGALQPEVHAINYVSRVTIPTLMLNGRYDYRYNYDINVKPFFELLGTPEKDKRLIPYETDHYVPKSEIMKESLKWLDKYFGPAK